MNCDIWSCFRIYADNFSILQTNSLILCDLGENLCVLGG